MSSPLLFKSTSALVLVIAAVATSPALADGTAPCNDSAVAGTECGTGSVAGDGATAVGFFSTATGLFSVAVGQASTANADNATAVGTLAMATGVGSTALGTGAIASAENSVAIGINAEASAVNSVALGANSIANQANTVSVGSFLGTRRIVNVAAGTAATDAVNFGQLTSTNSAVAAVQAVNTTQNGQIAAIQAVDTTQNGQITSLQAADTAFRSRLDSFDFDLGRDRRDARAGTSAALAAAGMPQAMDPGKSMISGGVGYYHGRAAIAIGGSHRVANGSTIFKVGVTYDSSKTVGANGGVGFQF